MVMGMPNGPWSKTEIQKLRYELRQILLYVRISELFFQFLGVLENHSIL